MSKLLKILLVEDSENDALLLLRHIQRIGYEVLFDRVVDLQEQKDSLIWKVQKQSLSMRTKNLFEIC